MALMPTIQIDGRPLHYRESSPTGETALVLIHGAGGSHRVWPAALTGLGNGSPDDGAPASHRPSPDRPATRVIALDLPGHGLSATPGRRSVAHYAAVVEAWLAALNLSNPLLLGHSMGSAIALTVAHRAVVPVRGLVLLGAGARLPVGDALLGGSIASLEAAADFIVDYGFAAPAPETRQAIRDEIMATGATTTFGDFLACNRFDFRPQAAGLLTPALIISGDLDRLTPPRFARSLADALPHGRLVTLPDAGHFAMLDQPEAVAEHVRRFIRE
jgi:pimeloyl-ACP methyl ester carboxylesterase